MGDLVGDWWEESPKNYQNVCSVVKIQFGISQKFPKLGRLDFKSIRLRKAKPP